MSYTDSSKREAAYLLKVTQVMLDNVRDRLRIRRTSRPQAKNVIAQKCYLVGRSRGGVGSHRCTSVGTQHDTAIKGHGQNGRPCRLFALFQTIRIVRVGRKRCRTSKRHG
jgi:hypothetical protein